MVPAPPLLKPADAPEALPLRLEGAQEVEPEGGVVIDGRTPVRDLNRQCDWALPEDEAVTVAGLVMRVARRIPAEGEEVAVAGYRITVLERDDTDVPATADEAFEDWVRQIRDQAYVEIRPLD